MVEEKASRKFTLIAAGLQVEIPALGTKVVVLNAHVCLQVATAAIGLVDRRTCVDDEGVGKTDGSPHLCRRPLVGRRNIGGT